MVKRPGPTWWKDHQRRVFSGFSQLDSLSTSLLGLRVQAVYVMLCCTLLVITCFFVVQFFFACVSLLMFFFLQYRRTLTPGSYRVVLYDFSLFIL